MPAPSLRPLLFLVLTVVPLFPSAGQQPDAASRADAAAAQAPAPAAGVRYWTTNWSWQNVDVGQLLSRLDSIGLSVPIRGQGDVSVAFTVSVPLNRLRDAKAYRFNGQLSSNRLLLDNLLLEDFDAVVSYADGVLSLPSIDGRWIDAQSVASATTTNSTDEATFERDAGSFKGMARAELLPRGDFQAEVEAKSLAFAPLIDLFIAAAQPSGLKPTGGIVDGKLEFKAPIDQLRKVDRWTVDANLNVTALRVGVSAPLSASTGPVTIRDGIVSAQQIAVRWDDRESKGLDLSLQADLQRQQQFQFEVRGNDVPLDTLAELGIADRVVEGKLDLQASGSGTLSDRQWSIAGRVGSPSLTLFGQNLGVLEHEFEFNSTRLRMVPLDPAAAESYDAMLLKDFSAQYQLDDQTLSISDLEAHVFGGQIKGLATLARIPTLSHQVDMTWENISPVLSTAPLLGVPAKVTAVTSGSANWSAPAGMLDQPAMHRGTVDVNFEQITLAGATVGELSIQVESQRGTFAIDGQGTLFGGTLTVKTESQIAAGASWGTLLSTNQTGRIEARSMQLSSAVSALSPRSGYRFAGRLSALLQIDAGDDSRTQPRGNLTLTATDLSVDGRRISRQLTTRLRLQNQSIVVDRTSGSFAGGRLWADGQWSLGSRPSQIHLRISAVDASDAMLVFSPKASACADGKISGRLTVTQGQPFRITGVITARNSTFFAVPTGTVHTGVTASLANDLRRWRVHLSSIDGELAGGRIQGEADLSSSAIRPGAFDLSSRWKAKKIDFGQMLAATQSTNSFAHGRITGNLTVHGRGIRSVNDLAGNFDARLDSTQAAAIPGLTQADRLLSLVSLSGVQFTEGTLDGIIAGGVAKIDTLWLRSSQVRMWAEGRIRLADARMNMDVVLSTGTYSAQGRLVAFGTQLAVQSVLPIATLIEINQLLSDRTIFLAFEGPLSDPRVRLKPLEIIREEALRLLIREILVAESATSNN